MRRHLLLKTSSILISLALCLGCGGGGEEDSSGDQGQSGNKELSVEIAVRTVRELASASSMSARWSLPDQLSALVSADCPRIRLEPEDGAGFSYELDFEDGCGGPGLPFRVSGSFGGSVHAGTRSFEVSSFYNNFSAGLGTINGSSSGSYSLVNENGTEQIGIAAELSVDQSLTASGFSLRVQGALEERFMLGPNPSAPFLHVAIDTANLSVSLNGTREFAVEADNIEISSSAGMLPSSGRVTVTEQLSAASTTVVVNFDATTPQNGLISVTSGGVTELFDLNQLGL